METTNAKHEENHFIGIDLGTTNTYACLSKIENEILLDIDPLIIPQLRSNYTQTHLENLPSIVYFIEDTEFDEKYLVGEGAKEAIQTSPSRVIRSSKSHIGTDQIYFIDNISYTPIDITSFILSTVKESSSLTEEFLKGNIIVGVPSRFSAEQKADTLTAVRSVFKNANIRLVEEPNAIAMWFLYNELQMDSLERFRRKWHTGKRRLLVIDMGGGTLDIAIVEANFRQNVELNKDDYNTYPLVKRIAIGDYMQCAGDQFDQLVADQLRKELYPMITDEEYNHYKLWFLEQAEQIKLRISRKMKRKESSTDVHMTLYYPDGKIERKKTIWNKNKYYNVVQPLLTPQGFVFYHDRIENYHRDESLKQTILRPIIDAFIQLDPEDRLIDGRLFDEFILAGGMAEFPLIREIFSGILDEEPAELYEDPKKAVAKGLIVEGYFKRSGNIEPNPIGRSYAIKGVDRDNKIIWREIINRRSPLPVIKKSILAGNLDSDRTDFIFTLGRENISESRYIPIRDRLIKVDPPSLNQIKIYLDILIDESGALEITAKRDDTLERVEIISISKEDEVVEREDERIKGLIQSSRVLTREILEEMIKKTEEIEERKDESPKTVLREFNKILKESVTHKKELRKWGKKLARLKDSHAVMKRSYQSYLSRFKRLDRNISKGKISFAELNQYILLFGDIIREHLYRREPFEENQMILHIINDLIDAVLKFDLRSKILAPLMRLIRYLISVNTDLRIPRLLELLHYSLRKEGTWLDDTYYILCLIENSPKELILQIVSSLEKKHGFHAVHALGLFGKRCYESQLFDLDTLKTAWSTLFHFLFAIMEKNPYGISLPPLPSEIISLSRFESSIDEFTRYCEEMIEKLFFTIGYILNVGINLPSQSLYIEVLKEMIKSDKLPDPLHNRAQLCLFWCEGYEPFKELEFQETARLIINHYLQFD